MFTFGLNTSGQLGQKSRNSPKPQHSKIKCSEAVHVTGVRGRHVRAIACGANSTVVLFNDNSVFQAGPPASTDEFTEVKLFSSSSAKAPPSIALRDVSCSATEACVISDTCAFLWSTVSIGHPSSHQQHQQQQQQEHNRRPPCRLALPRLAQESGEELVSCKAGGLFFLFLTSDGAVYCHGFNAWGALGIGVKDEKYRVGSGVPLKRLHYFDSIAKCRIGQIACGACHSVAVSADGARLFVWGRNDRGQLGVGEEDEKKKIETVASDATTNINGELFFPTPVEVRFPPTTTTQGRSSMSVVIRQVACGDLFTHIVTSQGELYSCGENKCGQLGIAEPPLAHDHQQEQEQEGEKGGGGGTSRGTCVRSFVRVPVPGSVTSCAAGGGFGQGHSVILVEQTDNKDDNTSASTMASNTTFHGCELFGTGSNNFKQLSAATATTTTAMTASCSFSYAPIVLPPPQDDACSRPEAVPSHKNEKSKLLLACGWNHSAVCCTNATWEEDDDVAMMLRASYEKSRKIAPMERLCYDVRDLILEFVGTAVFGRCDVLSLALASWHWYDRIRISEAWLEKLVTQVAPFQYVSVVARKKRKQQTATGSVNRQEEETACYEEDGEEDEEAAAMTCTRFKQGLLSVEDTRANFNTNLTRCGVPVPAAACLGLYDFRSEYVFARQFRMASITGHGSAVDTRCSVLTCPNEACCHASVSRSAPDKAPWSRASGVFSKISNFFSSSSAQQQREIMMGGLDNGGKSTLLYKLNDQQTPETTILTAGLLIETISLQGYKITGYDCNSAFRMENLLLSYCCKNAVGLIFVIDCTDLDRLDDARDALTRLLQNEYSQGKPVLIIANKQGIRTSIFPQQIVEFLGLGKEEEEEGDTKKKKGSLPSIPSLMKDRLWCVQGATTLTGVASLFAGLHWLHCAIETTGRNEAKK